MANSVLTDALAAKYAEVVWFRSICGCSETEILGVATRVDNNDVCGDNDDLCNFHVSLSKYHRCGAGYFH